MKNFVRTLVFGIAFVFLINIIFTKNDIIIKNYNSSKITTGYEKWTIADKIYKYDYYMGLHPQWKKSGLETKASGYLFSNEYSDNFNFNINIDNNLVSIYGKVSKNSSSDYYINADESRWSKVGVVGDVELTYYKKDVYNQIGDYVKTYYEWHGRALNTRPIAIYS